MKLIYGVKDPLPLKGFPEGRIKIKSRNDSFVKAYVKDKNGIKQFYVTEQDGYWVPACEVARNCRTENYRSEVF